jgi:hypothetical protein
MMDLDYYKMDDQAYEEYFEKTQIAFDEIQKAKEEENKNQEEEKLHDEFESKLNLPRDKYDKYDAKGRGPSADKKKGTKKRTTGKGGSSPRIGGMSKTSDSKTSHKNKKKQQSEVID